MEEKIDELLKMVVELKTENKELKHCFSENKRLTLQLEQSLNENRQIAVLLKQTLHYLDTQNRRNSLVFYGIKEENNEDNITTEDKVETIITNNMHISLSNEIEKAHRIGKITANDNEHKKCRPVLVKFSSVRDKEHVFKHRRILQNTAYSISEHLTRHSQDKIQKLRTNLKKQVKGNNIENDYLNKIDETTNNLIINDDTIMVDKEMPSTSKQVIKKNDNKKDVILEVVDNTPLSIRRHFSDKGMDKHNISPKLLDLYIDVMKYKSNGLNDTASMICVSLEEDIINADCHPYVTTMMFILGDHYRNTKNIEKSASIINKTLTYQLSALIPNNDNAIVDTMEVQIDINDQLNNTTEAVAIAERVFLIKKLKRQSPLGLIRLLNKLGEGQFKKAQYTLSVNYLEKAVTIIEDTATDYEYEDSAIIIIKANLARCYCKQNKYDESYKIYKEIINKEHEKVFGVITDDNKPLWQLIEDCMYAGGRSHFDDRDWPKLPNTVTKEVYIVFEYLREYYHQKNTRNANYLTLLKSYMDRVKPNS